MLSIFLIRMIFLLYLNSLLRDASNCSFWFCGQYKFYLFMKCIAGLRIGLKESENFLFVDLYNGLSPLFFKIIELPIEIVGKLILESPQSFTWILGRPSTITKYCLNSKWISNTNIYKNLVGYVWVSFVFQICWSICEPLSSMRYRVNDVPIPE